MASPVTASIPVAGNLYTATTLAASANIGIFIDLTAVFEGQIDVRETTGATAASTSGASIAFYHVLSSTTTTTTITGGTTTSIVVTSATGLAKGQKIAIGGTTTGEIVTISAISGTTITINAPLNSYSGTINVYLISQTAAVTGPILGQNLTNANTTYGMPFFMQTGAYFVSLTNLDVTNAITVEITGRNITGVA